MVGSRGFHKTTTKDVKTEGGSHGSTLLHGHIMCMTNSDCPQHLPVCIPGQHIADTLSKLNGKDALFIGIIFVLMWLW